MLCTCAAVPGRAGPGLDQGRVKPFKEYSRYARRPVISSAGAARPLGNRFEQLRGRLSRAAPIDEEGLR